MAGPVYPDPTAERRAWFRECRRAGLSRREARVAAAELAGQSATFKPCAIGFQCIKAGRAPLTVVFIGDTRIEFEENDVPGQNHFPPPFPIHPRCDPNSQIDDFIRRANLKALGGIP